MASSSHPLILSSSYDMTLKCWSYSNLLLSLEGHKAPILDFDVSGDGSKVVSGGRDGSVFFWDLGSGENTPIRAKKFFKIYDLLHN